MREVRHEYEGLVGEVRGPVRAELVEQLLWFEPQKIACLIVPNNHCDCRNGRGVAGGVLRRLWGI